MVKGRTCTCGFATVADKIACPRCGKTTLETEWEDRGRVLSYVKLESVPDGYAEPMGLATVEIDAKGPKIACWSKDDLAVGTVVAVRKGTATTYVCYRQDKD